MSVHTSTPRYNPLMTLLLLVVALFGISLWGPLNRRHARHYWKTAWDRRVPLVPLFVVPYVSLFPFVIFAFVTLFFSPVASMFYTSIAIASFSAALFWYLFPTGFRHPFNVGQGKLRRVLKEIYHHEGFANAFPSSHVYLSIISGYFLALAFPPFAILIWAIALCIAVSTVFVRQHELLDILGGLAWAAVSIALAFYLLAG